MSEAERLAQKMASVDQNCLACGTGTCAWCYETALKPYAEALIAARDALFDLRESCVDAYGHGKIPAFPRVRAGNVLADLNVLIGTEP